MYVVIQYINFKMYNSDSIDWVNYVTHSHSFLYSFRSVLWCLSRAPYLLSLKQYIKIVHSILLQFRVTIFCFSSLLLCLTSFSVVRSFVRSLNHLLFSLARSTALKLCIVFRICADFHLSFSSFFFFLFSSRNQALRIINDIEWRLFNHIYRYEMQVFIAFFRMMCPTTTKMIPRRSRMPNRIALRYYVNFVRTQLTNKYNDVAWNSSHPRNNFICFIQKVV